MNKFKSTDGKHKRLQSRWKAARGPIVRGEPNKEFTQAFVLEVRGSGVDPRDNVEDWLSDLSYVYDRRHLPEEMQRIGDFYGVPASQVMARALLPIDNFMSGL